MVKILVVEDEMPIAEGLIFNLHRKSYEVVHVADGLKALEVLDKDKFDLILLDLRLPGADGFQICQKLREKKNYVPILMLTARDQPDDVVYGLKCGADDYMTKPFDLAELLARVEGMLRRRNWLDNEGLPQDDIWTFGKFFVDFKRYEASTLNGVVELSQKELEVLALFRNKIGEAVTREELLEKVWKLPQHPNTRVVDNVIVSLRKHFETDSQKPKHILNIRGVGYKFVE